MVSPNTLSTGTLGGRPWAKALSGSTCVKSKWIPLSAACHSSYKKSQLTPWGYQGLIKDESRDRRILYHMAMSPLPECSRRKKNMLQLKRVTSERCPALLELSDSNSTSRRQKLSGCIFSVSCLYSLSASSVIPRASPLFSKSMEGRRGYFH